MNNTEYPNCPACGAKAIRDDSITNGAECSFCALVTDWENFLI